MKFSNSSETKGKKIHFFVSTYDKLDSSELYKNNVERICQKTKLYTVESCDPKRRESVENLYATTIERDYNKFYKLITNEKITNISLEERELIIITIISLYLRNVFWFNKFNDFWTDLIKRHDSPAPSNVYSENGEILFPFETKTMDEIISSQKNENKQAFIQEHLQLTINLVKSHFNDIIIVDSNKSKIEFITSDRPVIGTTVASSFMLPIDSNYLVRIIPISENIGNNFQKIIRNFPITFNPRQYNVFQYENAERLVIGKNMNDIRLSKDDYNEQIKTLLK
jgi:hypothetical protein